jgi:hypothetical protein
VVTKGRSTTHSFSSFVSCKIAFHLNANAIRRQLQKLSSKCDPNPEKIKTEISVKELVKIRSPQLRL